MLLHLFVKLLLLLIYFILLMVLVRLLDVSAWYETGFLAAHLVDPFSLSVRKLKLLLEARGLGYEGLLEREELVQLAETSGDIRAGDLSLLEKKSENEPKQQKSEEFNGRAHFLEEVEDKKDSVWLIQVIPGAATPLLGSSIWKSVIQKVSFFGIRTGVFVCARDIRFCRQKGWHKPFVLLAMPEGQQYKDRVVMKQLFAPLKSSAVVDWVNSQLSAKLSEIHDPDELCDGWLEPKQREDYSQNVRAVVFTQEEIPSILYSALSMRYSGRIKFGFYRKGSVRCIDLKPDSKTHLVVSTSDGVFLYGQRKGEYLNIDALDVYFHTLVPEINDVFICSFVMVNIFCFMDLFLTSGGLAKILLCFFWQLGKLNLFFILCWLPLQWTFQLPVLAPFSKFVWWAVQVFFQTRFAGQLRQDWLLHSDHWVFACIMFCVYCFVTGHFVKKCRPQSQEDTLSSVEWMRLAFHQWHLFMIRPRNGWHQGGPQISTNLEEGMDLFMERVTPDLWLHPVITGEYIHNLPQWKFGGFRKSSEAGFKRLCRSCQSVWKGFFCLRAEEDRQETFEKACEKIREMFANKVTTKEKTISDVPDVKSFNKEKGGNHDDWVIMKQPEISKKGKTVESACSDDNVFCQKCLDIICSGREAENFDPSTIKEPPFLHQDVKQSTCQISENKSVLEDLIPKMKSEEMFDPWPEEILQSHDCAICLEMYTPGSSLCGLPCGHAFHFECVQVWLCGGKHCCPTCRWPAFKRKPSKLSKYKE